MNCPANASAGMGRCSITLVKKSPGFTRRKFSTAARKAIISYYTEQEKLEILKAANKQGISVSSFVASAVLEQARRTNRKH